MTQGAHAPTHLTNDSCEAGCDVWTGVSSHDKETARSSRNENAKVYYEWLMAMKASRASIAGDKRRLIQPDNS